MRKWLALCLALLMVLPLFAACKAKTGSLTLFEGGSGVLIYDADLLNFKEAGEFAAKIEKATGAKLTTAKGYSGSAPRIVLGNVDAESVRAVTGNLRKNDYVLKISGEDYIIGATSTTALKKAMQYFLDNILTGAKDGVLKLSAKQDYLFEDTYKVDGFSVGGISLSSMEIVVPKSPTVSEYRTAVLLQQHLLNYVGYSLPLKKGVINEGAAGWIKIGASLCEKAKAGEAHSYAVAVSGSTMEIVAEDFYGYEAVQSLLQSTVFAARNQQKEMNDDTAFSGTGDAKDVLNHEGDVRLAFHNIHGSCDPAEFPVSPVADMMSEVFAEYLPDVLGLQECSPQMRSSGNIEGKLAPLYTEVDVLSSPYYRRNGSQNFTPLFYRADTLDLLKAGFFGYNAIPYDNDAYTSLRKGQTAETLLNGNTPQNGGTSTSRADKSKSVTWAVFRHKATGKIFMAASTHLWWENNDEGDRAMRQIQMCYLKDLLMKEAKNYLAETNNAADILPIFVGGDYNSSYAASNNKPTQMTANTPKLLCDSEINTMFENTNGKAPAEKQITTSTHHEYATWNEALGIYTDPDRTSEDYNKSLDYIFSCRAAADMTEIRRSSLVNELYSFLSSDHTPLFIDFSFTAAAPRG